MTGAVSASDHHSMTLALPRLMAFAGCCIVAALNARLAPIASVIERLGVSNAFFSLFEISVVIWFAFYAAWTIAKSDEAQAEPWRRGDGIVLALLIIAILLPLPMPSITAGFGSGVWLFVSSKPGSAARRVAVILTAITAQQIFGRLFMTLFSDIILAADIFLVNIVSGLQSDGNVMTRADGSALIVAAGCSSINNMSYALLAWVAVSQLFQLRLDRRLIGYAMLSLTAIFLLNSLRLLLMAWYPAHFDFLHAGSGAAMFGWAGFLLLAIVAGVAVLNLAPRRRPA